MERDKGIEPSPPPWQGGVLPLYESRKEFSRFDFSFIARQKSRDKAGRAHTTAPQRLANGAKCFELIHFQDSGGLDHGRFLLPLGKPLSAIAIDIHAGEFLPVLVVHGDLPVAVFSTAVTVHFARFFAPFFCQFPCLSSGDYRRIRKGRASIYLWVNAPILLFGCLRKPSWGVYP